MAESEEEINTFPVRRHTRQLQTGAQTKKASIYVISDSEQDDDSEYQLDEDMSEEEEEDTDFSP